MSARWRLRLAASLLGVALLATSPGVSVAAERREARLEPARTRCLAGIDARLARVKAAKTVVEAVGDKGNPEHIAALTSHLSAAETSLNESRGLVAADTTLAGLAEHCKAVAEGLRAYVLLLPTVRLVLTADILLVAANRVDSIVIRLEAAVAKAKEDGKDTTTAEADLATLKAEVASLRSEADKVPGEVLGLTAADWNADHRVLAGPRESLRAARQDLADARAAAAKVRQDLAAG